MYIGIDLEVNYWLRTGYVGALLSSAKDINKFRQEVDAINPNDFMKAQIIDKEKNQIVVTTKDELLDILYKYMFRI